MARDMTAQFEEGQFASTGERCPYLATSDSELAWRAGRAMPTVRARKVTAARGESLRVDGVHYFYKRNVDRFVPYADR